MARPGSARVSESRHFVVCTFPSTACPEPPPSPPQVVPENRRRPATFRGLCIARKNRGLGSSFTLRNVFDDVAIERSFPTYSPHLTSLKIIERRKARSADALQFVCCDLAVAWGDVSLTYDSQRR